MPGGPLVLLVGEAAIFAGMVALWIPALCCSGFHGSFAC
jgi:hypothetical protein